MDPVKLLRAAQACSTGIRRAVTLGFDREGLPTGDVLCSLRRHFPQSLGDFTGYDLFSNRRRDHCKNNPRAIGGTEVSCYDRREIPPRARIRALVSAPLQLCKERD